MFNYHGQYEQKLGQTGVPYEEDIELLEREIDNAIRGGSSTGPARGGSFVDKRIINMSVGVNRNRTQTAGTAPVGQRRKIPKHSSVGAAQ